MWKHGWAANCRKPFDPIASINIKNLLMCVLDRISLFFCQLLQAGFFWHLDHSDSSISYPTVSSCRNESVEAPPSPGLAVPFYPFPLAIILRKLLYACSKRSTIVLCVSLAALGARHCATQNKNIVVASKSTWPSKLPRASVVRMPVF